MINHPFAINIVRCIDKDYQHDVESILYVFANKFLERFRKSKGRIKND